MPTASSAARRTSPTTSSGARGCTPQSPCVCTQLATPGGAVPSGCCVRIHGLRGERPVPAAHVTVANRARALVVPFLFIRSQGAGACGAWQ